ncbi:MAG TPA: XRE family transcriptional regulator [Ktedonobacteraceae bacterium]
MQSAKIEITIGSDNVFADIGHPHPEEALAKAKLIYHITTVIENRRLKRKDAAKLLRISPKEFSSVMDGRLLDEITIGQLTDYLAALNEHIGIIVRHSQEGPAQLHVTLG